LLSVPHFEVRRNRDKNVRFIADLFASGIVEEARILFVFRQRAHDFEPPAVVADAQAQSLGEIFEQAFVVIPIELRDNQGCAVRQMRGRVEDFIASSATHGSHYGGVPPYAVACAISLPATESTIEKEIVLDVDHLVYATPDLQAGIVEIERLMGVRATEGGQHPGAGTRNALVALGEASYLEIIGPDPEQETFVRPRLFGIDGLTSSRLVTWAAKAQDLDRLAVIDLGGSIRVG
jgi:hypothetical protein